jgi:signal peptidase II
MWAHVQITHVFVGVASLIYLAVVRNDDLHKIWNIDVTLIIKNMSLHSFSRRRIVPWVVVSTLVLLIDQMTKAVMVCSLKVGQSKTVTSFLNLALVYNKGAAFSILSRDSLWPRYLLIMIGVTVSLFMIYLLRVHAQKVIFCMALSLMIGGSLGNVIDRIMHGYVIDFFDLHILNWHWPTFNIADSAICIGAAFFLIDELNKIYR